MFMKNKKKLIITRARHWQLRHRFRAAPCVQAHGSSPADTLSVQGREARTDSCPWLSLPGLLVPSGRGTHEQPYYTQRRDRTQHLQSQRTSLRICRFPVLLRKSLSIYCYQQIVLFRGNYNTLHRVMSIFYSTEKIFFILDCKYRQTPGSKRVKFWRETPISFIFTIW